MPHSSLGCKDAGKCFCWCAHCHVRVHCRNHFKGCHFGCYGKLMEGMGAGVLAACPDAARAAQECSSAGILARTINDRQ